jgi:hypothetical protein
MTRRSRPATYFDAGHGDTLIDQREGGVIGIGVDLAGVRPLVTSHHGRQRPRGHRVGDTIVAVDGTTVSDRRPAGAFG